jgi:hypothetical protein
MEKTTILFHKELRGAVANIVVGRNLFFEDFSRD